MALYPANVKTISSDSASRVTRPGHPADRIAGGLRRSEIVSLDHGKDDTPDCSGWVAILAGGILITLCGSSDQTCPVHALTQWLHYASIAMTRHSQRHWVVIRMGFEFDRMEIKARHDFVSKAIDWRGLYRNAGV